MKSLIIKLAILIFVLSISLTSCSNNNDDNPIINNTQTKIEKNAEAGTWRITRYIDSGNDEVNHFAGYNFTFGANNVLTAKNVTNTYIGTWSITDNNSNDDILVLS